SVCAWQLPHVRVLICSDLVGVERRVYICGFFFSSRRRHTRSVSAFLLNRSSDLKFMRASIKMIGVSNLQSFIASMTQKLTLSDISDESKNYLDKAGITTACLRIKSKWTAGGK